MLTIVLFYLLFYFSQGAAPVIDVTILTLTIFVKPNVPLRSQAATNNLESLDSGFVANTAAIKIHDKWPLIPHGGTCASA